MAKGNPVEDAWNKTRRDNPEFAQVSPDFRAKLQSVYATAQAGGPESGIAGLEEFEKEIRKGAQSPEGESAAGRPSLRDDAARNAEAERSAEQTPKGGGAQDSEQKALKDAAAANRKVESDEVHSPSFPSAARPLAAEVPGNAPTEEEKAATGESAGDGDDAETSAASSKRGKLPEDFPGRVALEEAGVTTYGQVRKVKDLTELPGIGDATAAKIEEALAE
jgi:hypothetical protein